jgi:hypothetical protein
VVVFRLGQIELGEDVPDVLLDRSLGEPELTGDAGVRATFGHQRKHLAFARREIRQRVFTAPNLHQGLDEPWVDDRSTCRDPPKRLDELVHVDDPTLEQVADPLARREEVCRMLDLDVSREDEDADLRELFADRVRGFEPFGGVRRGHPDVNDHQIRLVLSHELDQLVRVARLADDLEVGPLEQAREPFAQKNVVVCQDDSTAAVLWCDDPSTLRRVAPLVGT